MAVSLTDILTALQNGVQAMNGMTKQLAATFPQASAVSTAVAISGTITFTSSQAQGFLTVITSSGATYHVPLYG
jgi:hypothetical protein